jgi:hypothetical protein
LIKQRHDHHTCAPPDDHGHPWRVLILDPSDDDPKWIIATVTAPTDVRAAVMLANGRRYGDWPAVTEWVRGQAGSRVRLMPLTAVVWRIDREGSAE